MCKRCQARRTDGTLDDGICSASLRGRLDFSGLHAGPLLYDGNRGGYYRDDCAALSSHPAWAKRGEACPACGGVAARPTRLDTPENLDKSPRQRGLGESFTEREKVDRESQSKEVRDD